MNDTVDRIALWGTVNAAPMVLQELVMFELKVEDPDPYLVTVRATGELAVWLTEEPLMSGQHVLAMGTFEPTGGPTGGYHVVLEHLGRDGFPEWSQA
ncbi:MAG: hypothetical protein QM705_11100 [Ancrocorticia sp.]